MYALKLPDPDDRHVLAAAIRAGAQVIVTANVRDFRAADRKITTDATPLPALGTSADRGEASLVIGPIGQE